MDLGPKHVIVRILGGIFRNYGRLLGTSRGRTKMYFWPTYVPTAQRAEGHLSPTEEQIRCLVADTDGDLAEDNDDQPSSDQMMVCLR